MIKIERTAPSVLSLYVDTGIFNERIISKVLYWLSDNFIFSWEKKSEVAIIQLEKKEGEISEEEFKILRIHLNQNFIDFKTRDIVNQETKSIRELLLVKAFSTTDDFDEENLFPHEI